MSSGELRHSVVIESQAGTPSTTGDYSANTTWSTVDTVWASIKYAGGGESSDDRDSTTQSATIKIRYRTDITNKMRITFDGLIFDIESHIDPSGRRKYLMLSTVISNGV